MNKKVGLVLLSVGLLAILILAFPEDNEVLSSSTKAELKGTDSLAMMYEIETDSGEYQTTSDVNWPLEGYVFNAELSRCENGSAISWDDESQAVVVETNKSDKCYVYFDKEDPTLGNFASYITTQVYTGTDGDNGLYYHDGLGNYTNANLEAEDNSYRYSGANPNNYVCFGATGADCQDANNQYRIIGVFNNQVKLIKATSYGDYAWDADNVNTWDGATKPDIYTTLNVSYYNALTSEWQSLIAETLWQVGGFTSLSRTVKEIYDVEAGTGQSGYEEIMKIGLMYVSDYGYGAPSSDWSVELSNYGEDTNARNNWLYLGSAEWTITRRSDFTIITFRVLDNGLVNTYSVSNAFGVRPSFYLNSSVELMGGTGSSSDPYILSV